MYYWVNYAQICNGEVKNIVVGDAFDCLQSAIAIYGNGSEVAKVSNPDIPVRIGDKYRDGKFYRDGEEVVALPTQSEAISNLTVFNRETRSTATNNGTSIIDIENAILEIYDIIGG